MKNKFIGITCVIFFSAINSFAQSSYVISTSLDTITGKVSIGPSQTVERAYVTDLDRKKYSFAANEVMVVVIDSTTYHPIRYRNTILFMKLLKPGYLSLYAYRIENDVRYDGWMLVKKDDTSLDVPSIGYKKHLKAFVSECPDIVEQIDGGTYPKKEMYTLVEAFNECIQRNTNKLLEGEPASDKTKAITQFREKINSLNFESKETTLDILEDIRKKSTEGKTIPKYQLDALSNSLKDVKEIQTELKDLISMISSE